jgi:hypothetical protein
MTMIAGFSVRRTLLTSLRVNCYVSRTTAGLLSHDAQAADNGDDDGDEEMRFVTQDRMCFRWKAAVLVEAQ